MCSLCSKVLDPLKVRHTLDWIAADTNNSNIYSDIYVKYRKRNCDMPTTKCKLKFSKILQGICIAKSKNKFDTFIYTFSRIFVLFFHSKVVFKKHFG